MTKPGPFCWMRENSERKISNMNRELDKFLNVHIPGNGYHAHNGEIELYSEKELIFHCGCGSSHPANKSLAIIDFPSENKAVYVCPNSDGIFTLVKATGIISIKGLKTVASYISTSQNERQEIIQILESRKKRD